MSRYGDFDVETLDETDRQHLALGFVRVVTPTPRLAELVELGRELAIAAVAEMRAAKRSPMDIERTALYRRSHGRWKLWTILRHENGTQRFPDGATKNLGAVGLDGRMVVGTGPFAGRVGVRISTTDYGQKAFAFDQLGVLHTDDSVEVVGPALDLKRTEERRAS